MKKPTVYLILHLVITIVALLLIYSMLSPSEPSVDSDELMYIRKINSVIKDLNFDTAELSENKITLFDESRDVIDEIAFADYEKDVKILYAYKKQSAIYYVTSAVIDDTCGIVFINDGSTDEIFDGIKTIKRVGGNSYWFSSMYE